MVSPWTAYYLNTTTLMKDSKNKLALWVVVHSLPFCLCFYVFMGSGQWAGHTIRQKHNGKLAYQMDALTGHSLMEITMGIWEVHLWWHVNAYQKRKETYFSTERWLGRHSDVFSWSELLVPWNELALEGCRMQRWTEYKRTHLTPSLNHKLSIKIVLWQ